VRILILTQYFPPEVGAPQNRLYELAVRLKKKGADVTVLTAMPNYPQMKIHAGYRGSWIKREEFNGLKIIRSWIFVSSNSSLIMRMMNYFSFVFSSLFTGLFTAGKQDVVFCESPPLFLGISAYLLSLHKRAKLVFNVSDLWPESAEKLRLVTNKFALSLATMLEEFLYKRSWLITGQTRGIVDNISGRLPDKKTYWLKNGANINLFDHSVDGLDWRKEHGFDLTCMIVMYAGILGHAQGLEVMLQAANKLKTNEEIAFVLIGSGPEKQMLLSLKEDLGLKNVTFMEVQLREKMPEILSSANAVVIPLKKLDLFKGAIPSKIFEALLMKKTILLGVEGEAKELFIDEGKAGLAFKPGSADHLAEQINNLYQNRHLERQYGENGYNYVKANFELDAIVEDFWKVLSEKDDSK